MAHSHSGGPAAERSENVPLGAVVIGLLALAGVAGYYFSDGPPPSAPYRINRIISLSPGATDLLDALGLFDRVVGVSEYCVWPETARALPKVGGYMTPNYEIIGSLAPDLTALATEQLPALPDLNAMGLATVTLDMRRLRTIKSSIRELARICDVAEAGEKLVASLEADFAEVRRWGECSPPPRVLIVIMRDAGRGSLEQVCAAGSGTFYDDLLTEIGAANAIGAESGVVGTYPYFSAEGIIALDPDVVIDIGGAGHIDEAGRDAYMADWNDAPIKAVRNNRAYMISEEYAMVPGSRLGLLARRLGELVWAGDE